METNGDLVVKNVQRATRADLFRILPFLEKHLPACCEVHLLVLSTLITCNPAYSVYFLRDRADDNYLAVVGVKEEQRLDSDSKHQKVWIMGGWCNSESWLLRVYEGIDKIDWKRDIVLAYNAGHQPHPDILQFFNDRHRIKMPFPLVDRFFVDAAEALNMQIELPEEVYVKSLEPSHAKIVFESWPYKHLTTLQDVTDEIVQLPSAGIFLKNNDELITWMMCHPPNGMSRLLTLEPHRRKGYASLVTKYLTKRMAQSGHFPYINIVAGNPVTRKFFESIGFRYLGAGHVWVTSPPRC